MEFWHNDRQYSKENVWRKTRKNIKVCKKCGRIFSKKSFCEEQKTSENQRVSKKIRKKHNLHTFTKLKEEDPRVFAVWNHLDTVNWVKNGSSKSAANSWNMNYAFSFLNLLRVAYTPWNSQIVWYPGPDYHRQKLPRLNLNRNFRLILTPNACSISVINNFYSSLLVEVWR